MDPPTSASASAASFDKLLSILAQQAGKSGPATPHAPNPYMRLLQEIAIRARNARAMGKEYAAAVVEAERADARYAARKRVYLRELEYEKTT